MRSSLLYTFAFVVFASSFAIAACSLFTDLNGFSTTVIGGDGGVSSSDAGDSSTISDSDGSTSPPSEAGSDTGSPSTPCVSDSNTICESFDVAATIPAGWTPSLNRGLATVEPNTLAPSKPNVLSLTTPGVDATNFGWAYIQRDVNVVPQETASFEHDIFVEAPSPQYQNLSTLDFTGNNIRYSLQLSRQGADLFIEELIKDQNGAQNSLLSARSTEMPTGKWVRVAVGIAKATKTFWVTLEGKPIITKAVRPDAAALDNGGALQVNIGLAYVPKAPSLNVKIDNVKITWK